MSRRSLTIAIAAAIAVAIVIGVNVSRPATSAPARVRMWMVPGAEFQVVSIVLRKAPFPANCPLAHCPTMGPADRPVRPRVAQITKHAWFGRFTDDLNSLPPWQQKLEGGCSFGKGAWMYSVNFRYDNGDRWTVTVDRGKTEEMVFADISDPFRGGGATCVSPATAAKLNRNLDAVFSTTS